MRLDLIAVLLILESDFFGEITSCQFLTQGIKPCLFIFESYAMLSIFVLAEFCGAKTSFFSYGNLSVLTCSIEIIDEDADLRISLNLYMPSFSV